MNTLHYGRDTLQAHPCINRRAGKCLSMINRNLVVLHKDQIPNFNKTISIFFWRTWRTSLIFIAVIIKNFRAWTTWPCITHRPKIIGGRNPDDTAIAQSRDLFPKVVSVVIFMKHCNKKLTLRYLELFGDQLPGELYCYIFKVISKGKIPQHFEKSVMPSRVANIFKIIVFAAGSYAFLCSRCSDIVTFF